MNLKDAQSARAVYERMIPVGTKWRHFKGGVYEIVAISCREEDGVLLVTYRSTGRQSPSVWTRTTENFLDWVMGIPRFGRVLD